MTEFELAQELKRMVESAPQGELSVMYHLFGIQYAEHLTERGTVGRIIKIAQLPDHGSEINAGKNLARYVALK